jgi:hypothetical protein
MHNSNFSFLPGLVLTILLEYLLLMAAFGFYRYYCCSCCLRSCYGAESSNNLSATPFWKFKFEDSFESFHPLLKYVLIGTRLQSLGYILCVSVIGNYVAVGGFQWFYFTLWNVELLSIYYILALTCSILGLFWKPAPVAIERRRIVTDNRDESEVTPNRTPTWSPSILVLGSFTHILFEVCGGTAVLVTVVNFSLINSDFSFWNATSHFVPLLTLVIELCLNNMYLRVDHYVFNISWAWLYLIFVWPLVVTRRINFWPYPFLALDTPSCYLLYTLLIIGNIVSYFFFYGLSTLKHYLRNKGFSDPRHTSNGKDVLPNV